MRLLLSRLIGSVVPSLAFGVLDDAVVHARPSRTYGQQSDVPRLVGRSGRIDERVQQKVQPSADSL